MKNYPVYIIAAFLVSLLLFVVLIYPSYKNLSTIKAEISQREGELEFQEEHFASLQDIFQKIKNIEDGIKKVESSLPDEPSLPELLNFLQNVASQAGVILEKVVVRAPITGKEKDLKISSVDLEVKGTYSDFKEFLYIAENSARIIDVQNIDFSYAPNQTMFDFDLTILVYSY